MGQNRTPQESFEVNPMKKLYRFKVVATIFCLSLVVPAVLPSAKADDWNKKTTVTFKSTRGGSGCRRSDLAGRHVCL